MFWGRRIEKISWNGGYGLGVSVDGKDLGGLSSEGNSLEWVRAGDAANNFVGRERKRVRRTDMRGNCVEITAVAQSAGLHA